MTCEFCCYVAAVLDLRLHTLTTETRLMDFELEFWVSASCVGCEETSSKVALEVSV